MATRRSAEEKKRIIDRCVELDKEGGDVLAYLASENYVSPRATWINIQRCDLEREQSQITDGLPHEVRRKKVHQEEYRKVDRVVAVQALIDGQNTGVDNYTTLKGLGYKNPGQAWRAICEWCQKHRPDLYAQMVNPTRPAIAPADEWIKQEEKTMTVEQAMEEITTAQNLAIVLDSMSQSEDGQTEVNLRKASTICVCYAEMIKKMEVKR